MAPKSASAGIDLLEGVLPPGGVVAEWGEAQRGTDAARHGFIWPDGTDECAAKSTVPS